MTAFRGPDTPEAARLAALDSYGILDTPAERGFDDIVLLASRICNAPVALVSLVAADRQWFKARIGFDPPETPLSHSVCAHTLQSPGLLVIPDLSADPRTRHNGLVTGPPHIRFYAGARLETPEGESLGALCVIDTAPRPGGLTPDQAEALEALARQVMTALELRRNLLSMEQRVAAQVSAKSRVWQLTPDLLGILNQQGFFETTNPAWQAMLGWSESEIASTRFFDFLHPDDLPENHAAWAKALAGQPAINVENRYRRRDGSYCWLSWIAVPDGDKIYCTARDITADKERASALLTERGTAELREQFIAVLGHDLRNPLASIAAGIRMLSKIAVGERGDFALRHMQQSVMRMAGLIDNVMDFARGRLGGGLALARSDRSSLTATLQLVITEIQATWPDRRIETSLDIACPVHCDDGRIAQLLSNLIGNAVMHGTADAPIRVHAHATPDMFTLSVANAGPPIPADAIGRLFQPFFRVAVLPSQQGLGLGLYIVSEIASAHGGMIEVQSTPDLTCFTFRMPNTPA
jgi:sigma-B regulation protein RsbU (phosphoserine phosphatase)